MKRQNFRKGTQETRAYDNAPMQNCDVSALECCGRSPRTGNPGLQNLRGHNAKPREGCLAAHREQLVDLVLRLGLWALASNTAYVADS